MKKLFALCLALCLLLCACGEKASFSEADLSLTVAGSEITASTSVEDALAAFGADYEYSEAISCVYEGMDKTYSYEDVVLYTYPAADGNGDCIMEVYCTAGDAATAGGITFGSSKEDVIAAYGGDYVESGSLMSYELPVSAEENLPASLYFELEDGVVTAFAITAEHRAE